MLCVTCKKSSWLVANGSCVNLTLEWLTARKASIKNASSTMAWVTTSTLNGMTKWHGAGHAAYDEAVTALGAEVTRRCDSFDPTRHRGHGRTGNGHTPFSGNGHTSLPISLIFGQVLESRLASPAYRCWDLPTGLVRANCRWPFTCCATWRPHWALNEHGSPPGPPESPAPGDKKKKRDTEGSSGGGASTPKRSKSKAV